MCRRLLLKHGTYAHQGWDGLYRDWRFRRGRFAHLAATSATSAPVTAAPPERYSTDQLQTFFRHAQPGPNMTESDRGEALAAMVSACGRRGLNSSLGGIPNQNGRICTMIGRTRGDGSTISGVSPRSGDPRRRHRPRHRTPRPQRRPLRRKAAVLIAGISATKSSSRYCKSTSHCWLQEWPRGSWRRSSLQRCGVARCGAV